ncbi:MAG: hypothetical protein ABI406_06775 [Ktedonobacteraceae bacterium]
MSMHESMPHVTLHPNDIVALENVIKGYLAFLHRGVPPAKKRAAQVRTLQRVQQRLTAMTNAHTEHTCVPLTATEIEALDGALRGFIMLVRRMVPTSKERDETLLEIENLRQQLAEMITPSTS